ncbi:hypothetical protein AB0C14_35920 [Microbispora hainanensis]
MPENRRVEGIVPTLSVRDTLRDGAVVGEPAGPEVSEDRIMGALAAG